LIEAKDAHGNVLDATIAASPTLASSDAKHLRNALYVNANVPLNATYSANAVTIPAEAMPVEGRGQTIQASNRLVGSGGNFLARPYKRTAVHAGGESDRATLSKASTLAN
jgi:hypothetical protein